jgi:type VI secretion system secreted protein Hcp
MTNVRMTLTSTRGGVMPPHVDRRPVGMPVLQYAHEVSSPRDPATGQATGKRQHLPVHVVHEVNEWSPFLLRAAVTNELFSSALVEFFEGDDVDPRKIYEVRLTHVVVSSLRKFMDDRGLMEEVQLMFQTIEETHTPSGNLGSDSVSQL